MKTQRLFQIPIVLTLLFGSLGTNQPVSASTVLQSQPSVSITILPALISLNESATATVSLNNVPAGGYTSAEFNCTYRADLLQISDIVVTGLFGPDPATAIYDQQDGAFIVGIAGSQGNRATAGSAVFTFRIKGLTTGQAGVDCTARVSDGTNVLTAIGSASAGIMVMEATATPTIAPAPCDRAEFIADITVPAGTLMTPGAPFLKTWRLKNVGSCTWTTSYRIALLSGEPMGAPSSAPFPVSVAPGQMVDVSLPMTAPSADGSYRSYWIFQNDTGKPFGIGLQGNQPWFVDIVVSSATFTPTPTLTPSFTPTPTLSPTPTFTHTPVLTPAGPTPTPLPGTVYDFAEHTCDAAWFIAADRLPCPGTYSDSRGFVVKIDNPRQETGDAGPRPGILTVPGSIPDGAIRGSFPPFRVQPGDRFRANLACEYGSTNCEAIFRLDYQAGPDPIRELWGPFVERDDGQSYSVDIDLSPLAGKEVRFILTVLPSDRWFEPRALWIAPIIYRSNTGSTPTFEPPTPTATSTAQAGEWLTLTNSTYGFRFQYPPDGFVVPGGTPWSTRILLPIVPGTNLREKQVSVMATENIDRCQSPLPESQPPETITINGITFLKEIFVTGGAGLTYKHISYFTGRDNRCVGFDFALHSIDPIIYHLPPEPPFNEAAELAVVEQILSTFTWLEITPTAAPTFTPTGTYTPTPTSSLAGTITGQVLAGKPVTLNLFDVEQRPVATASANADGTFSLSLPPGTYNLVAHAPGFLTAVDTVTITGGSTSTKPTITLPAGDIDNNGVIDRFDALTIGMNYNTAFPSAADLNNDGIINVLDLELLARNYRKAGPVAWQ